MSVWCKTDPDKLLKTKFCDPIQITQKGARPAGCGSTLTTPGLAISGTGRFFCARRSEGDRRGRPEGAMVRVPGIGWKADDGHHVALTFKNLDTGRPDAVTALYIDGKLVGEVKVGRSQWAGTSRRPAFTSRSATSG